MLQQTRLKDVKARLKQNETKIQQDGETTARTWIKRKSSIGLNEKFFLQLNHVKYIFVSFCAIIIIPSGSVEFYYACDKSALFVVCFRFVAILKVTVSQESLQNWKSAKAIFSNGNRQEVVHFRKNNNASAIKLNKETISLH